MAPGVERRSTHRRPPWFGPAHSWGSVLLADLGTDFLKPGEIKRLIDAAKRPRQRALLLTAVIFRSSRHPHCKRGPTIDEKTRFRYVFGNPTDHNREIILTVMVFDVPKV